MPTPIIQICLIKAQKTVRIDIIAKNNRSEGVVASHSSIYHSRKHLEAENSLTVRANFC
jgi:hypothetical protein